TVLEIELRGERHVPHPQHMAVIPWKQGPVDLANHQAFVLINEPKHPCFWVSTSGKLVQYGECLRTVRIKVLAVFGALLSPMLLECLPRTIFLAKGFQHRFTPPEQLANAYKG